MPRASLYLIVLCFLSSAFAQDAATGAIHGTVLDPTGAHIAQASIVAVSSATGVRFRSTRVSATLTRISAGAIAFIPEGSWSLFVVLRYLGAACSAATSLLPLACAGCSPRRA